MNDIALGLAWAKYLVNPSEEAIEEVLLALEGRPDLRGEDFRPQTPTPLTGRFLKHARLQFAGRGTTHGPA